MMLFLPILISKESMLKKNNFLLFPLTILGLIAFAWPLFLPESNFFILRSENAKWLATLILPLAILVFVLEINFGSLDSKSVALLGVFAALISALRLLGAGAIGIEPIWFLLILIGRVFGPSFGFTLGITSIFVSGLITGGVGPWLAFQMMAAGWVGMMAGLIPRKLSGKKEILTLCIYAVIASMFFGILMDLQLWPWLVGADSQLAYVPSDSISANLHRFLIFHFATSLAWDIPRAIFTLVLIITTGKPILTTLKRAESKLAFKTTAHVNQQKVA
jgi:energy-coupling factor transport system substrate-specific component